MTSFPLSGRRIVIAGAGSPRAVAAIRVLEHLGAELFVCDVSFHAAGLHLVPRERRIVLSPPDGCEFVPELLRECRRRCIEAIVPTETEGLLGLTAAKSLFEAHGVAMLAPGIEGASRCLDRLRFHHHVDSVFPTPRLFGVSSAAELARLPRPFEIEGRDPESGIEREYLLEIPERLRRTHGLRAVARRVLPGPELRVMVLGREPGVVEASVAVEYFQRLGDREPGPFRIIHDREVETLAEMVFEHLGLDGLVTVRVVRNVLGQPEVVSVDPILDASARLAAKAGRDLLGVAVARLFGASYELPPEPPKEIASVYVADEIFVEARTVFDTADLSDWSGELPIAVGASEAR